MTISTDGINNITDPDVERINRIRHKNGLPHLGKQEMIEHTKSHPAYTDSFDWLEFLTTFGHRVEDAVFGTHHEVPHADETDPVPVEVIPNLTPEPSQEPSQEPAPAQEPALAPASEPAPAAPADAPAAPVDSGPASA